MVIEGELEAILRELVKLCRRAIKPHVKKTRWEKAATISQTLLVPLVAVLGTLVTYYISTGQDRATNRQIAADFVTKLTNSKTGTARADILDSLDLAVERSKAVEIGMRFAHSPIRRIQVLEGKPDSYDQDQRDLDWATNQAAMRVLLRLKNSSEEQLRQFSQDSSPGHVVDSEIAKAILGEAITPQIRISEIDDRVKILLNGKQIPGADYHYSQVPDWLKLGHLQPDLNDIDVCVYNDAGPAGTRVELSLGAVQYDQRIIRENAPTSSASLRVHYAIFNRGNGHLYSPGVQIHSLPEPPDSFVAADRHCTELAETLSPVEHK